VIGVDPCRGWSARRVARDHPLFGLLVIDETSRLKDRAASAPARSEGRRALPARWGLTGTLGQTPPDLFMPAAIIATGRCGATPSSLAKRHFRAIRLARVGSCRRRRIAAEFGTIAMMVADTTCPTRRRSTSW
jgi:hypothetical protein